MTLADELVKQWDVFELFYFNLKDMLHLLVWPSGVFGVRLIILVPETRSFLLIIFNFDFWGVVAAKVITVCLDIIEVRANYCASVRTSLRALSWRMLN